MTCKRKSDKDQTQTVISWPECIEITTPIYAMETILELPLLHMEKKRIRWRYTGQTKYDTYFQNQIELYIHTVIKDSRNNKFFIISI